MSATRARAFRCGGESIRQADTFGVAGRRRRDALMRIALFVAATALASGCATRLPPVSASAPPELRIWHTVALLDDGVEGVVVTPGVVRFYAGPDRGSVKLVDMVRTALRRTCSTCIRG